ncbi:MAG TPA: VCBS repeat-containing protein [Pyrinomonadaceae bacterium]|nr:VCBS repeat-containing protein [Pyrinomonadaceae bacterium]
MLYKVSVGAVMKKPIIISFTAAFIIGIGVYAFYFMSKVMLQPAAQDSELKVAPPTLQASPGQEGDTAGVPPPPPPTSVGTTQTTPDSPRKLVGITEERLKQIEQSLPAGSRVYLSPVGSDNSVAALVDADLYGDTGKETVVVHTAKSPTSGEPTPPLILSLLSWNDGTGSIVATTPLSGGVIFNIKMSGSNVPLAVADLTEDGRPEIIVASGAGASLGGALRVFRIGGLSFTPLAEIEGNFFEVRPGRSGTITVRSRYENRPASYRWDGIQFARQQ